MRRSTGVDSLIGEREQTSAAAPVAIRRIVHARCRRGRGLGRAASIRRRSPRTWRSSQPSPSSWPTPARTEARYRLLETTRAYAHAKLDAAGEVDATARKHALYYAELLDLFKAATGGSGNSAPNTSPMRAPGWSWCFSAAGDAELAVRLANGSTRLFREFSLRANVGSGRLRAAHPPRIDAGHLLGSEPARLRSATASCSPRATASRRRTAFEKGLTIAQALGDDSRSVPAARRPAHVLPPAGRVRRAARRSPGGRRPSLPRWRIRRRSSGPMSCSASPTILPATRPPPMPPCRHRWSTFRTLQLREPTTWASSGQARWFWPGRCGCRAFRPGHCAHARSGSG